MYIFKKLSSDKKIIKHVVKLSGQHQYNFTTLPVDKENMLRCPKLITAGWGVEGKDKRG